MKEPLVTYIRIREIYQPYLKYCYGEFPIDLPEISELYDILSTSLVPNYSMKKLCYSTFSKAAYDAGVNGLQTICFAEEETKAYLPAEEDRSSLVPFIIPHTIISGGMRKRTDKWYQLSNKAYKFFKEKVRNDFWNALANFDRKVYLYCERENLKYSQELSVEKFMIKVGIDMDHFDSMCRYWREERKQRNSGIKQYSKKEPTANIREQLDFDLITEDKKLFSVYNR